MVTKYKVDGLQLDYIRYPFNNKGSEMGFNWLGRQKFERETGMSLDRLDDDTRQLWIAWKVNNVSSFVKDISETLRAASPGIRISAAVYALPKRMRIGAIQQEWETWVANGWVDTLNPMTYVDTPKELAEKAAYVRESCAGQSPFLSRPFNQTARYRWTDRTNGQCSRCRGHWGQRCLPSLIWTTKRSMYSRSDPIEDRRR